MNFKYRARASDGEMIEGYIEADSQKSALESLKNRGMIVINLNAQKDNAAFNQGNTILERIFLSRKVPTKTLMIFFRQMSAMVHAGLGIPAAINVITGQERNKTFKNSLTDIKNRLDRGVPLSQAMSQHGEFNALIISLIEAGETGGMLDNALEQTATFLEKQEAMKSKVRSALFYPVFVIAFAIFVAVIFFAFLVPRFKQVFDAMRIELPTLTAKLFGFGEWLINHWFGIAITFLIMYAILHVISSSRSTKIFMDRVKLRIPVLKNLVLKSSMARSMRTLSALISAGVPLMRGLEMAEGTAGNIAVQEAFAELRTGAARGISLGDSSKQAGIFPVLVSQMLRIGEETGRLDNMLERVASWYDQELDEQIKAAVSLLEPVMIIFVGLVVGIIALSIFGPVTSAMSRMI